MRLYLQSQYSTQFQQSIVNFISIRERPVVVIITTYYILVFLYGLGGK